MRRRHVVSRVWLSALAVFCCGALAAAGESLEIQVKAGDCAREFTPVCVEIALPDSLKGVPDSAIDAGLFEKGQPEPKRIPGQIERDAKGAAEARLHFVLPSLPAGAERTYRVELKKASGKTVGFTWKDTPGDHCDLLYGDRPVIRYMYAYDTSSKERHLATYKPYHHVFDSTGKKILTKGPGGLYPHHRALYIGWNKLKFGDKTYDHWHMRYHWKEDGKKRHKLIAQVHQKFVKREAGPVFGRMTALIHWNDAEDQPIIAEERTVTVYHLMGTAFLLDFDTTLRAPRGDVLLNGDKNHGGFQFRADNELADKEKQKNTRYIFADLKKKPPKAADIPWSAMSMVLEGKRYTVGHFNDPGNPQPTEYSQDRKYGRFGAFFKDHTIKKGEALALRYRIMVWEGETPPPAETIEAKHVDFIDPPQVTVLK